MLRRIIPLFLPFLAFLFLTSADVLGQAKKPAPPGPAICNFAYIPDDPFESTPRDISVALAKTRKVLSFTGAPEECCVGTFYLGISKDIGIVKFSATDLVFNKNIIPKTAFDIWIIHEMPYTDESSKPAGKVKLLVKGDPSSPSLAEMRLTGQPEVEVKSNVTRQVWVRMTIPRRTPAGTYVGSVVLSSKTGSWKIPVQVNVRPIRLLQASKRYGLINYYYPSTAPEDELHLQPSMPTSRPIPSSLYAELLRNLKSNGITMVSVSDHHDRLFDTLRMYKEAGMSIPVLYMGFGSWNIEPDAEKIKAMNKMRKQQNLPELMFSPWPYPVGIPDNIPVIKDYLYRIKREAWLNSAILIRDGETSDELMPVTTTPIFDIDSVCVQDYISGKRKRTLDHAEYVYWDGSTATPLASRINAGMRLSSCGLDGAFLLNEPLYAVTIPKSIYAGTPHLVYLGGNSWINTINVEALREGMNDIRYLTTLMGVYREALDKKLAPELTLEVSGYVKKLLATPAEKLTYSSLQDARAKMTDYIVKLRKVVPER